MKKRITILGLLMLLTFLATVGAIGETIYPPYIPGTFIVPENSSKHYENLVYGYEAFLPAELSPLSDEYLNEQVALQAHSSEPMYDLRIWVADTYRFELQLKKPTHKNFETELHSNLNMAEQILKDAPTDFIQKIELAGGNGKASVFPAGKMLEYSVEYDAKHEGKLKHFVDAYFDFYGDNNVEYILRILSDTLSYAESMEILRSIAESFKYEKIQITP